MEEVGVGQICRRVSVDHRAFEYSMYIMDKIMAYEKVSNVIGP